MDNAGSALVQRRHSSWIWIAGTFTTVIVLLLLVLRHGQAPTFEGGITADTGGRVAVIALALAAIVPAFVTRLELRVPRWIVPLTGGLSLTTLLVLWILVVTGRDTTAWSAYGGLQVLRARTTFADLDWVARALQCGGCEEWPQLHGPSINLINTLTLGTFGPDWVVPIGLLMALTMSVILAWLSNQSGDRGRVVLLVVAVSSAWILLLDRANLDAFVVIGIALGAWLISRRESLLTWSIFAALIFAIGTVKYYPFAAGLALIPALRLKRGWIVLASFAGLTGAYLVMIKDQLLRASQYNLTDVVVLYDFPTYGRLILLDRLGGSEQGSPMWFIGNALVLVLLIAVAGWGWNWARDLPSVNPAHVAMALGGPAVFLAVVVVSGFGYMYKGPFILLAVPLVAGLTRSQGGFETRAVLYGSMFVLISVVLAMTVAYSNLLATLSSILVVGFAIGAGLSQSWKLWSQARANARFSQVSIAAS